MQRRYRLLWLVFIILVFFGGTNIAKTVQAEGARHTVRVGYFPYDGYHMQDENGNKSGYGYDVLQKLLIYENWTYDYVGYDEDMSWSDMLEALDAGTIDMVTSATKTADRESRFDYSTQSIGTSSTIITVRSGNNTYDISDYSTWNGMTVGVMSGNSRNDSFASYAQTHGFTYTPITYDDYDTMQSDLQDGKLDAQVTSNLLTSDNTWVLDTFDSKPFYIIVKKGNTALLNQVNDALNNLMKDDPNFADELYQTYYSPNSGSEVSYTKDEQAFIDASNKKGTTYTAVINPDRQPASYYQDEQMAGILTDITREVFKRTGLSITIATTPDRDSYKKSLDDSNTVICCDMSNDYAFAENSGFILTNPYYNSTIAKLSRKDFNGTIASCAVVEGSTVDFRMKARYGNDLKVKYYPDSSACRDAVLNKEVDVAYLFTRNAQYLVSDDPSHSLVAVSLPNTSVDFCIGVRNTQDEMLTHIINKSVHSLSDEDIMYLTEPYTITSVQTSTLNSLLYDYPVILIILIILVLSIIFGTILLRITHRSQAAERVINIQLTNALAQAEQSNQAKTDFLSRMSHDLRTPLNGILGMVALSKNVTDVDQLTDNMNMIGESGDYLLSIINDTLDMNRIESNKLTLTPEAMVMTDMVEGVANMVRQSAKEDNILFSVDTQAVPDGTTIMADPVRLRQILMNLLSNAIKFTPKDGRVGLIATCTPTENGQTHAQFIVMDTGIGMSADFIKKIGEPFHQEHNALTSQYAGSGLGLAIVKNLCSLMNGQMKIDSTLGQGTTFTLDFDFDNAAPTQAQTAEATTDWEKALTGKHILLCEDQPMNALITRRLLNKVGITQLDHVTDGAAGVRAFTDAPAQTYDAVLMDIRMPVMDGLEASRRIRHIEEERGTGEHIPIIAMTANAFVEDVEESHAAGMDAHLAKPIIPTALYKTLAEYC